ncbi:MAG: hypothetical protein AAGH19_09245 [Pseudomonadota bacterium]
MKVCVFVAIFSVLLAAAASAQTLTGEPELLVARGEVIDGRVVGRVRQGGVDVDGNVASQPDEDGIGTLLVVTTNGVSSVIASTGDTAPGGGLIESINDHTEREGDLVLYLAGSIDDDVENFSGESALLLRDLNESDPEVIIRTNSTLLPGRDVPFTDLRASVGFSMASVRIALVGSYSDGNIIDGVFIEGVYLWENGVLSTLVDTEDAFGGLPFVFFNDAKPDKNGPGILFWAERRDGGDRVESVFLYENGNLLELISSGQPFPGSVSTIDSIGTPDIDGGRVVARLQGSGGEEGVFIIDTQGSTTLVADLTTPLPDTPTNSGPATSFEDQVGIAGSLVFFRAERAVNEPEVHLWRDGIIESAVLAGDQLDGRTVIGDTSDIERHSLSRNFLTIVLEFSEGPDALYRIPLFQSDVEPPPVGPPPGGSAIQPVPLPWAGTVLGLMLLLLGGHALRQKRQAAVSNG